MTLRFSSSARFAGMRPADRSNVPRRSPCTLAGTLIVCLGSLAVEPTVAAAERDGSQRSSDEKGGSSWSWAAVWDSPFDAFVTARRFGATIRSQSADGDASLFDPPAAGSEPDVTEPGPDMGDFPNSAYTLPRGRSYVEMAPFTLASADEFTPASYSWPFLLRYGITDDVELRILGAGLTSVFGDGDETGFSPVQFDVKAHLWDGNAERYVPASSLEVFVQPDWASPAFRAGTQLSLAMNFDLQVTPRLNFEWTLGAATVQEVVEVATGRRFSPRHRFVLPTLQRADLNAVEFSAQWAIEYDLTEALQVFVDGYWNGQAFLQPGDGVAVGGGLSYVFSRRLAGFASCTAGLTEETSPVLGQVGFAAAF